MEGRRGRAALIKLYSLISKLIRKKHADMFFIKLLFFSIIKFLQSQTLNNH